MSGQLAGGIFQAGDIFGGTGGVLGSLAGGDGLGSHPWGPGGRYGYQPYSKMLVGNRAIAGTLGEEPRAFSWGRVAVYTAVGLGVLYLLSHTTSMGRRIRAEEREAKWLRRAR